MKKLLFIVALLAWATGVQAGIRLPSHISENMVLQQQTQARLWGWADPGAGITVSTSWDGRSYSAKADRDGAWTVEVATPAGSYKEETVTISSGREKVVLGHVLIGEVWLGSGQSNMEMPLRGFDNCPVDGALQEIAESGRYRGRIRFSTVPKVGAYSPKDIVDAPWKESCPDNAPEFGAAAWFFAKNLNEVLDVPVGIINNAWGGSRVEGWLPREIVAGYPGVPSDSLAVSRIFEMNRPTIMYYGQWAPVRKYTFRGVIWYQGETNVGLDPLEYAKRMETLIALWRSETGNPGLPVYQVELAPYGDNDPDAFGYPVLREQQQKAARETENCWIVSTADLAHPYETAQIHPGRKREVGQRLSYLALNHTYGRTVFPGVAPEYASFDVDGEEVTVTFNNVRESGGFNLFDSIEGFELCGPDLVFHPAEARTQRNAVIVISPEVKQPVAVRYAFRNFRPGNLAGANGLAVPPFRSDRILEGETPANPADQPDGDFAGRWTGKAQGMGGQEMVFDLTFKKLADGSWQCEMPGQEPQAARVRGNRATVEFPFGNGMRMPIQVKIHDDGSVWVEMMGNPFAKLERK